MNSAIVQSGAAVLDEVARELARKPREGAGAEGQPHEAVGAARRPHRARRAEDRAHPGRGPGEVRDRAPRERVGNDLLEREDGRGPDDGSDVPRGRAAGKRWTPGTHHARNARHRAIRPESRERTEPTTR